MSDLAIISTTPFEIIINLVIDSLDSPNSKRSYASSLRCFFAWREGEGNPPFQKSTIQSYKEYLRKSGQSSSAVNLKLAAVRKLASEGLENGLLDPVIASGIANVHDLKGSGTRAGTWLSKDQVRALLSAPDRSTFEGKRDFAILCILLVGGLRRAELVSLDVSHLQQREGRWVLCDFIGKGNKVRLVCLTDWAAQAVQDWLLAANIKRGPIFRGFTSRHKNKIFNRRMVPELVLTVVTKYSRACGFIVRPHDLRRTYARLSYKGGSGLDQVSLSLGHANMQTTERYLGLAQNLADAPCDHLNLFD